MEKLVYSVQEAADMLGISKTYAYELVRKEIIPILKLGNKRVIPKEKFNNWVNGKNDMQKEL